VHYQRNDVYEMFEEQDLPGTASFAERELSLPLHPRLKDEDVGFVCELIAAGW
jgi:dTDP-4-amino-4,6-dideoxygalactose transaminase